MLGKLIKHELNATGRIFLPLYSILLLLSLVNRVLLNIDISSTPLIILRGFTVAAYVLSILAILVVTLVIMILRFYKNLMSDEGYMMFTLPVKPSKLISSKLIVSIIWIISSVVIVGSSLLIMLGTRQNLKEFGEILAYATDELKAALGSGYALLYVELIIMIILSIIQQILLIYLSIAVGHLFNGHRVLGSFVSYIGITMAIQIILMIILTVWARLAGTNLDGLEAIPQQVFPISIIISLALCGIFYFASNYIFTRKLNLE